MKTALEEVIPRCIFYALGNQEVVSEWSFLRFVAEVLLIAKGGVCVQRSATIFSSQKILVVTDDWTDDFSSVILSVSRIDGCDAIRYQIKNQLYFSSKLCSTHLLAFELNLKLSFAPEG